MAIEAQIELIRKNNSAGVTPYHDAVVFHSAIGHDYSGATKGVVYQGIYNEFGYSLSGLTLAVLSGMGQLYGRQFVIPAGKKVTVNLSGPYPNGWTAVFVAIDASTNPETIAVVSRNYSNRPSSSELLSGADLYANESGVSAMPLYLFNLSGGSASLAKDMRHIRKPGVAEEALSVPGSGRIRGNKVEDLVEEGTAYAKKARWADEAATSAKISGVAIDSHLKVAGKYGLVSASTSKVGLSQTIPLNGYFDIPRAQTKGSGELLGFMWYSYLRIYWSENESEGVTATGYVGRRTTFYLTRKTNVAEMPSTGICYEQDNSCYARVDIDSEKIRVTVLFSKVARASTGTGTEDVIFQEIYAGV